MDEDYDISEIFLFVLLARLRLLTKKPLRCNRLSITTARYIRCHWSVRVQTVT